MIDSLRTLFGIRKQRRGLPSTPVPQPGSSIVRNGYKIKLAQPCNPELWDWLLLVGWRVNPVRNDRRAYQNLPADAIRQLNAAGVENRAKVHEKLLQAAGAAK